MYGDRDYQCNWLGGEQISLAIQSSISDNFRKAGYADIHTNPTTVGGAVRQYGNLTFSRVFDAGHEGKTHKSSIWCTRLELGKLILEQYPFTNPRPHTVSSIES